MAAKKEISLLPREEFEKKPLGRFLVWALSVGRWIVVLTEFVVICAFLSRFYLDRRIADLHDDIFQKQAMIEAMSDFEQDFRFLQKRLKTIEGLMSKSTPSEVLETIVPLVPADVSLSSFKCSEGNIEISAVALSQYGLANFWHQLDRHEKFGDVKITRFSKDEKGEGIKFIFICKYISFVQVKEENAAKI